MIAFNAQYADVRRAIGGHLERGTPWIDLVRASVIAGKIPEAIGREEEWIAERKRMRGHYSIIRQVPDGRWFQVNERRMPNGGIAVVWTDISRLHKEMDLQMRIAEELRKLKVSLEQRVEERTTELQEALAQRDLLLREVYHRVKNNLQVVDSLIDMERRRLTDPDSREALEDLRSRVRTLGLVHAQLMTSGNLKTFDIAPFLRELTNNVSSAVRRHGARLTLDSVSVQVTMDFALPLGLIITELVTNAMKHAGPEEGEIVVGVTFSHAATPDEAANSGGNRQAAFCLTVTDNGSDAEALARIRSSSSVGRKIVRGLVTQMKGKITIDYVGGTHVKVLLPREDT